MARERSRYGLLVSAIGAVLLAVSVFLPWYGLSSTATGLHSSAVSAHQALENLSIVLLVLAGLALLDALIPLARASSSVPDGGGAAVVVLGGLATACVVYRMISPPGALGDQVAVSLREGAWLALAGSLAIVAGGLWSRRRSAASATAQPARQRAWTGLSGWTP